MKNIKLVAKIMLLVLLVTSAFSFVGCVGYSNKKYILGTYSNNSALTSQMRLRVTSDTKVFSKDNITLDLSYAMHGRNVWGKSSLEGTGDFYSSIVDKYDVLYGLYIITDKQNVWDDRYDASLCITDIEHVNDYYFINKVSENEALSEKYVRIYPGFAIGNGGDRYNHTESITIPKEIVDESEEKFTIAIIAFYWNAEYNAYVSFELSQIELRYKNIDENTIEIYMEELKLYFIIP